jgi:hypothetical protein
MLVQRVCVCGVGSFNGSLLIQFARRAVTGHQAHPTQAHPPPCFPPTAKCAPPVFRRASLDPCKGKTFSQQR